MSTGIMDIFKHLPAAKKTGSANCRKCGFPTCMMFAVKLSKNETDIEKCPCATDELIDLLSHSNKIQQEELRIDFKDRTIKIGGEKVLYRHEKTFLNPPPFFIKINNNETEDMIKRIADFKIENVGSFFKVDGVYIEKPDEQLKLMLEKYKINFIDANFLSRMTEVVDTNLAQTLDSLINIRKKAIVERNQDFIKPVYVRIKDTNPLKVCAKASAYICKYASLLIFDTFNEAVLTSLITLRQNIYTDPEMPLQVESKIYEFNNPGKDAYVFLTTNFALSYFAVANELSSLKKGSFLVITPSEGMSVLTAWSAQKITADIASRVVSASNTLDIVENKRLIIPGLIADLKDELQEQLPDWEIVIGTIEAYKIPEFVKQLDNSV